MDIYRYKFSDAFLSHLKAFIDIHRFDTIPLFKEAWTKWCGIYAEHIAIEHRRLEGLGYKGDVSEKMYKSVRYYYKNKSMEKVKPKKRQQYIRLTSEFLSIMDEFIRASKRDKPSNIYKLFKEQHEQNIKDIQCYLLEQGLHKDDIVLKIKKTFKNRYFRFITQ